MILLVASLERLISVIAWPVSRRSLSTLATTSLASLIQCWHFLVWSSLFLAMLDISSSEADVSSSADACSLAPSARDMLEVETSREASARGAEMPSIVSAVCRMDRVILAAIRKPTNPHPIITIAMAMMLCQMDEVI